MNYKEEASRTGELGGFAGNPVQSLLFAVCYGLLGSDFLLCVFCYHLVTETPHSGCQLDWVNRVIKF